MGCLSYAIDNPGAIIVYVTKGCIVETPEDVLIEFITPVIKDYSDVVGSVHSWELVTAVDGPGTRLTVFLSGCPLRCLYCHNPDTRFAKWGTQMTAQVLINKLHRYKKVFDATGGGLTISGGEPMQQPAFVEALVNACKEIGIHVTLDTSGYLGKRMSNRLLKNIDLFMLDVKSGDPEIYKEVTKRPLQPTLDFGRRIADMGKDIWIRFVLVPGLTDTVENVDLVAKYVASLGENVKRVEVLPFHQMGREKWDEVGLEYELTKTSPPTNEMTERVREQFRSYGLLTF